MKPASPVIHGQPETVFAKDQPCYTPLPAIKFNSGRVVTRWTLSFKERLRLMFGGSVYLQMLTFNQPLQPVKMTTDVTEVG